MIETLLGLVNVESLTPLDMVVLCMIFWLRSDLNKNTHALNNGLVSKVSEVQSNIALVASKVENLDKKLDVSTEKAKEECREHRQEIKELIEAKRK